MVVPFVGPDRAKLVHQLVAAFDEMRMEGARPRLITLEAATGWGKTRIVQEFYAALAERQDAPGYWPPSIAGTGPDAVDEAVHSERKRIFPARFEVAADVVPTYFWWGIAATRRQAGVTPVKALAEDGVQFEMHQAGLERRYRQVAGAGRRVGRAVRRHGRRAVGMGVGEVASGLLSAAFGMSFGPGLAIPAVVGAVRALRDARAPVGVIDIDAVSASTTQLAEGILSLARGGIPIVIAVEDVHTADDQLVALLLELLTGPPAPILVVATSWPGLLDEVQRPAHRLVQGGPASTTRRLRPEDLPILTLDDRAAIVAALIEGSSAEDRRRLAEHFLNPLALQLALTEPSPLVRALREGRLAAALEGFPTDVGGVYRVMWGELPRELRRSLALAVMTSPAGVGGELSSRAWDGELLASAATALPWLEGATGALAERLRDEPVMYGWARRVDDWLQMCVEPAQHDVATEARREVVSEEERRQVYTALAARIDLATSESTSRRSANAQLLLALALEGFIEWTHEVDSAVTIVVSDLLAESSAQPLRQALAILQRAPAGADETRLERLLAEGVANARLGLGAAAIAASEKALLLARQIGGEESEVTLAARLQLALHRPLVGDTQRGLEELEQVISDASDALGIMHEVTLVGHEAARELLAERSQFGEALVHATRLIEGRAQLLGRNQPQVLLDRLSRAQLFSAAGDVAGGLREAHRLVEDLGKVVGEEHPITMQARRLSLELKAEAGQAQAAVVELGSLIEDQSRVLGADHLETSITRSLRATLNARLGLTQKALAECHDLVEESIRHFGYDTPDTIRLMQAYVRLQAESGQIEAAMDEAYRLYEGAAATLGPESPWTLRARELEIGVLSRVVPGEKAMRAYESLIADMVRILGRDDPTTLSTRERYALLLHRLGQFDAALVEVDTVIWELGRSLGAMNPKTLAARVLRLDHLSTRVDLDPLQGVTAASELLSDHLRVLGPDHPETLQVRQYLAEFTIMSGQRSEAADMIRSLVRDRIRVLGEDHTDTMLSRNDLAHLLEDLGQDEAALFEFRAVVDTKVRLFGWTNSGVVTGLFHLAHLNSQLMSTPAREHALRLVEECRRAYGPDSSILEHVRAALESDGCRHGTWGSQRLEDSVGTHDHGAS